MDRRVMPLLLLGATSLVVNPVVGKIFAARRCGDVEGDLYQFSAKTLNGSEVINFDRYRGKQEPGANATEIYNGIRHVRPGGGFETKITLFEKTDVNGQHENEIFTFLKSACTYTDTDFETRLYYEPKRVGDIHWNFEKFLVGRDGKPRVRYHPEVTDPEALKGDIGTLLYEYPPSGTLGNVHQQRGMY
ncbi:Glutathione peroxidase-like 1 [Homarus americanus]|uniref:glutathione peroxidase n=1 Tax=Homarus americanus TaxID=6706 RepID=A0A8J5N8S0_HOMAM|nr:Glutathione peroxidase-like 1 [Homarus americanus]